MQRTPIEWTDFSANPLKYRNAAGEVVWACVHASPGCVNCYSEQIATRYRRGGPFNVPTMAKLTPFLDEKELRSMLTYKPARGKMCFPFDMTDLFGEWVPDALLDEVFSNVLELRRDVTWQLLTKRIDRARNYLTWRWQDRLIPRHIWIGTSVEDQKRAGERIPLLLQAPAAVRFISAEPLLGPIDLTAVPAWLTHASQWPALHWCIVGGESGHGARPFDLAWARSIVQQCKAAGVPVFVKQLGARPFDSSAKHLPADVMFIHDKKGGDMAEWPEDLRVREFPSVAR